MFGVLAEDDTDVAVIRVVVQRLVGRHVAVKGRAGSGCANLRRKAARWMAELADGGICDIILLHDLDRDPWTNALRSESELRRRLSEMPVPPSVERLICIPVEEIEAWFWSDTVVVKQVGRGKGEGVPSPHLKSSPKDALIRLSLAANGKPRYSTNDNPRLAETLDLDVCASRCPSFRELRDFVFARQQIAQGSHT
jgi:hypothetical protein